jgi:1-pyrroline-5-carboxylate dehydrogenase
MVDSAPLPKITYATLRNDNADLHAAYDAGVEQARSRLGDGYENLIGGAPRGSDEHFEIRSPIDTDIVVAVVARGTRQDARDAIAAARAAQPAWRATPWRERLAILRTVADLISERQMEYGALVAHEVGKSRLEALGEVEEAADLIRYYGEVFERNGGYEHPMDNLGDPSVHTRSVLRPFGVFAVISPFNFPMALAMGPAAGAMMGGNTVVLKPATAASLSGLLLAEAIRDAGVPDGVFNIVCGPGDTVGAELQENDGIDGIVFTGSYEVGMGIFRSFSRRYPKPTIIEMGGKNPAIVCATADLEEAAEGIMRSAFGFGGQKCSANSRVYVERPVHDELVRLLVEKTERIAVGDPLDRDTWLGPIIDARAVARFQAAVADARRDGRVFTGGERITGGTFDRGFFVEPTVVGGLPADHRLFQDELFVPFTAVHAVDSLGEAIDLANDSLYGLTAGVFTGRPEEVETFLDRIQAGVLYVNRRAGATTGAWPGVQPFGGWKGSGSTGKSGLSLYYPSQFMREQSHTIVD